jgi:hypothetical protein
VYESSTASCLFVDVRSLAALQLYNYHNLKDAISLIDKYLQTTVLILENAALNVIVFLTSSHCSEDLRNLVGLATMNIVHTRKPTLALPSCMDPQFLLSRGSRQHNYQILFRHIALTTHVFFATSQVSLCMT